MIIEQPNSTSLLMNSYPFNESYTEIIYSLKNKTDYYNDDYRNNLCMIVDHNNFRVPNSWFFSKAPDEWTKNNKSYAFGLSIDPFRTNILPLDYDNISYSLLEKYAIAILSLDEIVGIDILRTNIAATHFHLHIGFDKHYNVFSFLKDTNISNLMCSGFLSNILKKQYIIIRTSQKFSESSRDNTMIKPITCFRKEKDIIYEYKNIVPPIILSKQDTENNSIKKGICLR